MPFLTKSKYPVGLINRLTTYSDNVKSSIHEYQNTEKYLTHHLKLDFLISFLKPNFGISVKVSKYKDFCQTKFHFYLTIRSKSAYF